MSNYNELYEKRLKETSNKILGSKLNVELEIKTISNTKLESLYVDMESITGKPVYEDFNYRSGAILGILKHIAQNSKHSKALYELTGLKRAHIELYYSFCGCLPYVNKGDNTINSGRQMDIEGTKELIKITAVQLGVIIEDEDMTDINKERWEKMYSTALETASKTVEFNENNPDTIYDE